MDLVPIGRQEYFLVWLFEGGIYGRGMLIKICRLRKAIYGLKQNPMAWFEKFSITISGIGLHRYHSDHSVFIRRTKSG